MNPLISVIIPCHNDHARLPLVLQSFSEQAAAPNFEIIVVDDSSQPSVRPICEHYNVRYERIECGNANAARNRGCTVARGSIMVFFDSDNIALPSFLATLTAPLTAGKADVCYGRSELIGTTDIVRYNPFNRRLYSYEDLKMGSSIDTACAVRAAILPVSPWDEQVDRYQDWDFHLTLMQRGARYHFVDQIVYHYFIPPHSLQKKFRTFQFRNSSYNYIRHKHQLATAGKALITLALPTIGRYYSASRWLDCIAALDFPKSQLNLQFIDLSNDPTFFTTVLWPFMVAHQSEYAGIQLDAQRTARNEPDPLDGRALTLRLFAHHATTPYIFFLDDDTLCPPTTLQKLLPQLTDDAAVGAVQGIERSRTVQYSIGAWRFVDGVPKNLFFERQSAGTTPVGAGGFYCLMTKTDLIERCPFRAHHSTTGGPEIAFGWWLAQQSKKILTDWDVQCTHLLHSPSGKTTDLTLHSFAEPAELFKTAWLPDAAYPHTPAPADSLPILPTRPADSTAKPVLLLHHVTTPEDVWLYLAHATIQPTDLQTLCLVATDGLAHQKLAAATFPAGTVLLGQQRNLADFLNTLLQESCSMLILAHAHTAPCNFMIDHFAYILDAGAAATAGTIHTAIGPTWSGGSFQLHPDLCAFNPARITAPLFEPRLAKDLHGLVFAAALELRQRHTPAAPPHWPIATTRLTLAQLTRPDFQTFGLLFGLYVPIQRLPNYTWRVVHQELHASLRDMMRFLWGVGRDTAARIFASQTRHFRTP